MSKREISLALERILTARANKAAVVIVTPRKPIDWVSWAQRGIGIATGIWAIIGIGFWISEGPARDIQRAAQTAELAGKAQGVIRAALDAGRFDDSDFQIQWALQTLVRLQQKISIKSDGILAIGDFDYDCANVQIIAPEVLWYGGFARRSLIEISTRRLTMTDVAAYEAEFTIYPEEGITTDVDLSSGAFDRTTFMFGSAGLGAFDRGAPIIAHVNSIRGRDLVFTDGEEWRYPWIGPVYSGLVPGEGCDFEMAKESDGANQCNALDDKLPSGPLTWKPESLYYVERGVTSRTVTPPECKTPRPS